MVTNFVTISALKLEAANIGNSKKMPEKTSFEF